MSHDTDKAAAGGALDRAASWAALASGMLLLCMMLLGALDVAGSWLLGRPVPGAFEATEMLLAAAALLPLAHITRTGAMIRVSFIHDRLPRPLRRAADALAALLSTGFFALLAWQAWLLAAASLDVGEYAPGPVPFPVAPAKIALALALTLGALAAAAGAVRACTPESPWTR